MGATGFIEEGIGSSARAVFEDLCECAVMERGNDSYNGTISTCSMGKCTKTFEKPTQTAEKQAYRHIDSRGGGEKWVADYVDLGVVGYRVYTIKAVPVKAENPKYEMQYVFRVLGYSGEVLKENGYKTKKEAEHTAMGFALKNPGYKYAVEKRYMLVGGSAKVSEVIVEKKNYKTKPNLKPMPNRRIEEIRKYIFYGFAAC